VAISRDDDGRMLLRVRGLKARHHNFTIMHVHAHLAPISARSRCDLGYISQGEPRAADFHDELDALDLLGDALELRSAVRFARRRGR